jgi:hypothetical protein
LDRLTALGNVQLTSDKPRRYRHQAATARPGRDHCRVRVPVNNSAPIEH